MVIFIGGSWGVGEWKFHQLSGPGVANYFSEHDITVNLCRSSTNARQQLDVLKEFLIKYKHDHSDVFYWLVHNPLVSVPIEEVYLTCTSLEDSIRELINKQLAMANEIAQEYDILIRLVGASCDLNTIDVTPFDKLLLLLPSWGELLVEGYPASIFAHQADHLTDLRQGITDKRPDLLDEYNKITGIAFKKRKFMQKNEEMFHSFHPTSLGHLKLRDYLCSEEAFQLHKNKEIK